MKIKILIEYIPEDGEKAMETVRKVEIVSERESDHVSAVSNLFHRGLLALGYEPKTAEEAVPYIYNI